MSRALLSHLAHADHPIAAPLSDASVERLLSRARLAPGARVLDVGCGQGAWIVRALAAAPTARGDGVDLSPHAVEAARERARAAGVDARLALHGVAAEAFAHDGAAYDLVLCVGATHALGGFSRALDAARAWARAPGGLLLVGEAFWARAPTDAALAALGARADDFDTLPALVARADAAGWTVVYGHVSSEAEWDEYEWSWSGTLARWALAHPADPLAADAARVAREHRDGWLAGYRGVLGFVTLLLAAG